MRSLESRANGLLFLAVIMAAIPIVLGPSPFAKLEDFTSVRGDIAEAKMVSHIGQRSTSYDLQIALIKGETYYLCYPEQEPVIAYLTALPASGPIIIHFRNDWTGHRIYDVRDENRIYIPFKELIAEANHRRNGICALAGGIALLGFILRIWARRRNKPIDANALIA